MSSILPALARTGADTNIGALQAEELHGSPRSVIQIRAGSPGVSTHSAPCPSTSRLPGPAGRSSTQTHAGVQHARRNPDQPDSSD